MTTKRLPVPIRCTSGPASHPNPVPRTSPRAHGSSPAGKREEALRKLIAYRWLLERRQRIQAQSDVRCSVSPEAP